MVIVIHCKCTGGCTASPVGGLEGFVNRTVLKNFNLTGADNITPCIKVSAAVYGNLTACIHSDEAYGAVNTAHNLTCTAGILSACNTELTVYGNFSTVCHFQRTECGGSYMRISLLVNSYRDVSVNGICIISGNEQGRACGNCVITCTENTVCNKNNCCSANSRLVDVGGKVIACLKECCTVGVCKYGD